MHSVIQNILLALSFSNLLANSESVTTITPRTRQQQQGFCDPACQTLIDASYEYTNSLYEDSTKKHEDMLKRVIQLEAESVENIFAINRLIDRVDKLETHLARNVTALNTKIEVDTRAIYDLSFAELEAVRSQLNNRVNNADSEIGKLKTAVQNLQNNPGSGSNPEAAMEVFYNLTRRIDVIEYGKISNLSMDNGIWRKNFRVINATFEKIKQNNNCLCK